MVHFDAFLKTWFLWSYSDTRQVNLIGQKLLENAKIQNSNATFLVNFKQCAAVKQLKSF